MADTASTRHALLLMETGSHDNTWGIELNDVIQHLEDMAKGSRTTSTTGGTTTLTTTTSREPVQRITGILVSNVIIEVPAAATSWWFFKNETTGDYTVTVKVTGQTGVIVPQSGTKMLRCNGTDVVDGGLPSRASRDVLATVGGTVDALTLAFLPAFTTYPIGIFYWISPGPNTVTDPVANPDGLGNKTIKKGASVALAVGDTGAAGYLCMGFCNGTDILLLNPSSTTILATTTEVLTGTDAAKIVTADAIAALWEKGSDIASAATITIGEGGTFDVTGTTTITDIDPGTDKAGRTFSLVHEGIHTLTHNASTMINLTGADIITAVGDISTWQSEGSDVVRMIGYSRADGTDLAVSAGFTMVFKTADENRASTTVLADDAELNFSVASAGTYIIRGQLWYNSASVTPDLKYAVIGPSATGQFFKTDGRADDVTAGTALVAITASTTYIPSTSITINSTPATFYAEFTIRVVMSAGGTVKVQFAQNTSNVATLIGLAGSYIEYKKVA